MLFLVWWSVVRGQEFFGGAVVRYGLLERLRRAAGERGVEVVAFGMGREDVRLMLRGDADAVLNVVRGVKVGTIRAIESAGGRVKLGDTQREVVEDVEEAVAWCHRLPVDDGAPGPLASAWSSHRDLMGWRRAAFFDPAPLEGLVDVGKVHARLGGQVRPSRRYRGARREPLTMLLRLAAAVQGLLPSDKRCFGVFCQLARARGWETVELARALMLTSRRVRQLCEGRDPMVRVALRALGDPVLCCVP